MSYGNHDTVNTSNDFIKLSIQHLVFDFGEQLNVTIYQFFWIARTSSTSFCSTYEWNRDEVDSCSRPKQICQHYRFQQVLRKILCLGMFTPFCLAMIPSYQRLLQIHELHRLLRKHEDTVYHRQPKLGDQLQHHRRCQRAPATFKQSLRELIWFLV